MKCPQCHSTQTAKNGHRRGRQCYKCKQCGRQFLESYRPWRYSDEVKQLCIKMYLNGMGLRGIERVTEIHHTTIMHWIREAGHPLQDAPDAEELPEVTDKKTNCKPLLATNATSCGFGRLLITLVQEFWHGSSATALLQPLKRCGRWSNAGNASSMSQMD